MPAPSDRKYLPTHEWHLIQGDAATIGISQFAADELTDITFVELPKIGATVAAGQAFGQIESVKATSDLYTGVSGKVTAVNAALRDNPGLVNHEPYTGGWMIKVQMTNPADADTLLAGEEYLKHIGQ